MFISFFPTFVPSLVYNLLKEKKGDVVDLKQYGKIRDRSKKNAQGERKRERERGGGGRVAVRKREADKLSERSCII